MREVRSSRYSQHGLASTFGQSGPGLLKFKDPDPQMENPDTVSSSNTL